MKSLLQNRRGILVVLASVLFVAAALGSAIPFFYGGLPDPAKANRHELLRWLITRDLAAETPTVRLALARRLETEFGSGVDWSKYQGKIDDAQRAQLLKNIPVVLRPWIQEKADAYARLAANEQAAFVDRLIDMLEVWRGIEELLPQPAENGPAAKESCALAAMLQQEIKGLEKESPAPRQKQISQLWSDVQWRWVMRALAPKT